MSRKGNIMGRIKFNNNSTKDDISFNELLDRYVNKAKIQNRADETIRGYHYASKYFLEFANNDLMCRSINAELIDNYMLYLKNKGLKPVSVNSYVKNIKPIIKYGQELGYISYFKFTDMIEQTEVKEIYSQEELTLLLARPKHKSFIEHRNWCIVWLLTTTGIRAKELRYLEIKNLDLANNKLSVNVTKSKEYRILPLSNSMVAVFNEYLTYRGTDNGYLFPNQFGNLLARTTLQKAIKLYNNLRGVNKTSIHLFRHSFITNMVANNVSSLLLMKITGHKSMRVLNNYYHTNTSDLTNIVEEFTPKIKTKKYKG